MEKVSSSLFLKFTLLCFIFSFQSFYSQDFNVLIFHQTNGFRHNAAINASISMLEDLGANEAHDTWVVDSTRDASVFTTENLANYEVIVFSNTTGGDLLDDDQKAAMENFIQNGGGFVGFHSATDTYRGTDEGSSWPWYNELVGAIVQTGPNHTSNNLPGTMNVLVDHPVIDHIGTIGDVWEHEEEWYYWELNGGQLSNTNENLLEVQSTGNESYDATRPITWLKEFDGGRSFYTALGHNATTYNDNESFREMVEKAILWVSNRLGDDSTLTNTDLENSITKGFSLHPNPFFSTLMFQNLINANVVISNTKGEIVFSEKIANKSQLIDLEYLKSGIYFAQIKVENKVTTKKIIKRN